MKYVKNYTCPAQLSNISQEICHEMLQYDRNVTEISISNSVSRKHLYTQMQKFDNNVQGMFQKDDEADKVLYYLPVTPEWLASFVLSLMFDCKGSYRGIQRSARSLLDLKLSHDFISAACSKAKKKAAELNSMYDLSSIIDAAFDELFHLGQPILGGIDLKSLYCTNLRKEGDRSGATWAANLNECKAAGLNPERVIADAGSGIAYGVSEVFKETKLERDLFHNIQDMYEMRRFFYNRMKSLTTAVETINKRIIKPGNKNTTQNQFSSM